MAAVAKAPVCLHLNFWGPWVRILTGPKFFLFFHEKNFFYYFFLSFVPCIELVILWGMFTNHMDMQKGGEVLKASIINNLAQCASACMHTCVHGLVCGWWHVFLHAWMAACIFTFMDGYMYGSQLAWLHGHTGSESKVSWFNNSTFAKTNFILALYAHCAYIHACSDPYMQSFIHAKMHSAIHACKNTCSHAHIKPCTQACIHARVWLRGWRCSTWIKLI